MILELLCILMLFIVSSNTIIEIIKREDWTGFISGILKYQFTLRSVKYKCLKDVTKNCVFF